MSSLHKHIYSHVHTHPKQLSGRVFADWGTLFLNSDRLPTWQQMVCYCKREWHTKKSKSTNPMVSISHEKWHVLFFWRQNENFRRGISATGTTRVGQNQYWETAWGQGRHQPSLVRSSQFPQLLPGPRHPPGDVAAPAAPPHGEVATQPRKHPTGQDRLGAAEGMQGGANPGRCSRNTTEQGTCVFHLQPLWGWGRSRTHPTWPQSGQHRGAYGVVSPSVPSTPRGSPQSTCSVLLPTRGQGGHMGSPGNTLVGKSAQRSLV